MAAALLPIQVWAEPPTPTPASPAPPAQKLSQIEKALHAQPTERGLLVVLSGDALFGPPPDSGSALRDGGAAPLEAAARLIALFQPREVVVAGNTDGAGRDDANLVLSQRRAEAVAAWLKAHIGKRRPRFVVEGFGRTRPVAPNFNPDGTADPAGRAQNRRIDLYLLR